MESLTQTILLYDVNNPFEYYQAYTLNTLDDKTREKYRQIFFEYQSCFINTKKGDFENALVHLENGNIWFHQACKELQDFVTVFCMPFTSYYYYKCKDFKNAILKTEFIIDQIIELEHKGYAYLFFSRIQQQQNIARIFWATREIEKALAIYSECVINIYTKASNWKDSQLIQDIPLSTIAEDTQYQFFLQVFIETLNYIFKTFSKDRVLVAHYIRIFLKPIDTLQLRQIKLEDKYASFYDFVYLFQLFVDRDDKGFTDAALEFLDMQEFDVELKKTICRYLYHFNYV